MLGLKWGRTMFFKSDYNDLLPPEPESDELSVQKRGLPLLLDLLGRHCGALLKANLLFLLGCVPVLTIPLSFYALNRTVRRMVLDQPVNCLQSYREVFRHEWKRGYAAFLLTVLPMGCAGYGMWFYLRQTASSLLLYLPFLVCSTAFLAAFLSSECLYGLLNSGKSLKESAQLAILLGIGKPVRAIPAALCYYGLPLFAVLCFPLSGLYLLVIGFSLPCFLGNFLLRDLLQPYQAENP